MRAAGQSAVLHGARGAGRGGGGAEQRPAAHLLPSRAERGVRGGGGAGGGTGGGSRLLQPHLPHPDQDPARAAAASAARAQDL